MSSPDLAIADKDTSKSCIFAFPDRPIDSLPPNLPPGTPPDLYPYDPMDDWPPIPPNPPVEGIDPIPGINPHPHTPTGSLHSFNNVNVDDIYRPTGPYITTGVAMYRKAGVDISGNFIGQLASPVLAFPVPNIDGNRLLNFSYRSLTSSGSETFWWLVIFNSLLITDRTHQMVALAGGEGSGIGITAPPGSVIMHTTGIIILYPEGMITGGWVAQCNNGGDTVTNNFALHDNF